VITLFGVSLQLSVFLFYAISALIVLILGYVEHRKICREKLIKERGGWPRDATRGDLVVHWFFILIVALVPGGNTLVAGVGVLLAIVGSKWWKTPL
jgi:hypothetical protein